VFLYESKRRTPIEIRFFVGKNPVSRFASSDRIVDSFLYNSACPEMISQRRQTRFQVVLVLFLDRRPDPAMQLEAPVRCQVIVQNFTDKSVRKLLACGAWRGASENSDSNRFIYPLDYLFRHTLGNSLQQSRVKFSSNYGCD
jgi:hypothetical protein